MSEADYLAHIRALHAEIHPAKWSKAADGEGEFVEALGPMGELLQVFRFHPGASHAEKLFAVSGPEFVDFLLGLVDRCARRVRALEGRPAAAPPADHGHGGKDYAAQAAMLCGAPAFLRFLADRHGLEPPLDAERAAQRVRSICSVRSRKEFNDSAAAAARWKSLFGAFENWKRAG